MALVWDGSGTYFARQSSALAGVEASKLGTVSLWFKTDGDCMLFTGRTSGALGMLEVEITSGKVQVTLATNPAGLDNSWIAITTNTYNDDEWHHLAVSWDLANTTAHLYVDRANDQNDTLAAQDESLDWTAAVNWFIGSSSAVPANVLNGSIYDLVFWPGKFIDLSDADELATLVSSDGRTHASRTDIHWQNPGPDSGPKPVGYGAEASKPAGGIRPAIYFGGAWHKNRGTGGAFTKNGDFTASSVAGPNIYRASALRPTPGERWFDSERSGFSYPRSETIVEQREGIPSFGKRIGKDEVDEKTRQERPGLSFRQIVMGTPGLEDDSAEERR